MHGHVFLMVLGNADIRCFSDLCKNVLSDCFTCTIKDLCVILTSRFIIF